ncbi:MAG: YggS family pyridoxal phosphate-dependent enzyme, partial [Bacteroidales bacterium]|nr:YggS family pyridoxal phosphate-dependent enzyme [Bacteroidales bacterium]
MENTIKTNLEIILNRIKDACEAANRSNEEVKLLLATKTVSADNIKIALKNNQTLIGENKINEIKEKYKALKNIQHQQHFIGHLQSNKVKDLLKY